MNLNLRDLFSPSGTIGRGSYALVGFLGFALKHNLDRLVAGHLFGRSWELFNYWVPLERAARIHELPREEAQFLATMALLALPFIWVGVVLTLRRLRSAGLPVWLVVGFFLPFLNLLFFLLLCLLPERQEAEHLPKRDGRAGVLSRILPEHPLGSAAVAVAVTLTVGVASIWAGTFILTLYGWGLFVALPFCMGMLAVLLYGYHRPRQWYACQGVVVSSILLAGGVLLALAIEGLLCLLMALPFALSLGMLGGWVGYLIQARIWGRREAQAMLLLVAFFSPLLMGAERAFPPPAKLFEVTTSVEVAAPPEIVWRHVVSFSELPGPAEWLFRAGIAYPMRAEIRGQGPGAIRHCVFSTGSFVEPIEVWEEPRLLRFSVVANPPPMEEWTPYGSLHLPHLEGFLLSERGQFRLVELPGGRTRLEGTTWYRHGLWPEGYWRLWSDAIIHRIHVRVLRHIQSLAEAEAAAGALTPPGS